MAPSVSGAVGNGFSTPNPTHNQQELQEYKERVDELENAIENIKTKAKEAIEEREETIETLKAKAK